MDYLDLLIELEEMRIAHEHLRDEEIVARYVRSVHAIADAMLERAYND